MIRRTLLALWLTAAPSIAAEAAPPHGLRLPAGFEVTEFADGTLAPDIHCLTIDPAGRVIVSGRGYVRVLIEGKGGRAARALDFADAPKDGAQGLFWEKGSLYVVGDGGLRVFADAGGAGRDRPSELLFRCTTGSEHTAHAVGRGPDGWMYLLVGDGTKVTATPPTLPTSPIKEPVGGRVLRFPPDFAGCEVVADGFRNAYGMDWNLDGELFTFDSDNERCVSLPWYEPTRLYHVRPGGRHGWLHPPHTTFWRLPPHAVDVEAPAATLGRGSPTGVVCYRHAQFPARYRGGLFLLDWTFGKVHFVPLSRRGSGFQGKPEVFLESVGDNGFAPTAAAVHPRTGDLFVSIGGRGTRGAVYRVRHAAGLAALRPGDLDTLPRPAPRSLGWAKGGQAELVRRATADKSDPHRRRIALEAILRHRGRFAQDQLDAVVVAASDTPDRGLRQAAARLLAAGGPGAAKRLAARLTSPWQRSVLFLADPSPDAAALLADPRTRLDAARLVQIALGDVGAPSARGTVWEGYSRRSTARAVPAGLSAALVAALGKSSGDDRRELARTLGMVEADDPAALDAVAGDLTPAASPTDDVHALIVLSRLTARRPRTVTTRTADALVGLDAKLIARKLHRESNWPLRLAELHAALVRRDPALNAAVLGHRDFGRPDHVLFCRCPGFDRQGAARRFLARADADAAFPWNAELVGLVGEVEAKAALPRLRRLWGEAGLDEAILSVLAKVGGAEDHARFITGLGSPRAAAVADALTGLEKRPPPAAGEARHTDEAFALVRAARQLGAGKEEAALRGRLLGRLGRLTGARHADVPAALAWLRKAHPGLASRLDAADGIDVAGWRKRLAGIDWAKGDARRGLTVYTRASCATCHAGATALGPDLRGVAGRFSRDDLFTAILRPSKDVSPRYRTTQVVTNRGKAYQGIVAYEAFDGILLLTGPGQAVRLPQTQISERRLTPLSLMPAGLLDRLADGEIADLYAHLRALK